jgi:peptidoglycan/xylan/chitin deacetylase (PgdA/CDA1 family)
MGRKIKHKRGMEQNLPTLDIGELAITTNTEKAFMGFPSGNKELASTQHVDDLGTQLAQNVQEKRTFTKSRGMVVIETDDSLIEDYTVLLPFLNARGVPATTAIVSNKVGTSGYMSWTQIHELINQHGWSASSHTHNHVKLGEVSRQVIEDECRLSKQAIEAQGIRCDHLTYPNGSYNDEVMEVAKKYYLTGATVDAYPGYNDIPAQSMRLRRSSILSRSLTQIEQDIDKTYKNDGLLIIYTHGGDFANSAEIQQKLSDAIEYAKGLGLPFENKDKAWDEIGNIFDVGIYGNDSLTLESFALSKRGTFALQDNKFPMLYLSREKNIPVNTTFASTYYFPENRITYNQIEASGATGYPENKAGTLITNKIIDYSGYPFQEYHIHGENKIYRRVWRFDAWQEWELITNVRVDVLNKVTASTPITDFKFGVTITPISQVGGMTDFPKGVGGVLTTYRIHTEYGWSYQEYKLYNSHEKFIRFSSSGNGEWSDWRSIGSVEVGNNLNGYFIRHSDGTLEQWGVLEGVLTDRSAGAMYRSGAQIITFPRTFTNTDYSVSASSDNNLTWANAYPSAGENTSVVLWGSENGLNAKIHWKAIGKWK